MVTVEAFKGAEAHFQPELSHFQAELLVEICFYIIDDERRFSKVVNQAKAPNNYFRQFSCDSTITFRVSI